MSKTIYVASGLGNYAQVLEVERRLGIHGWDVAFSWAYWYKTHRDDPAYAEAQARKEIALKEAVTVQKVDHLLVLCPGARGTHFELGLAWACNKKITVVNPNQNDDIPFYHLPFIRLTRSVDSALRSLCEEES